MSELFDAIRSNGATVWFLLASVLMFFGSIILAWVFILRIPPDYLTSDRPARHTLRAHHPVIGLILLIIKNLFGLLLMISGFIMLFIPGQGVMFILLGLTLVDFPGRKNFIRRVIGWRNTLKVINGIRRKAHKPTLESPAHLD